MAKRGESGLSFVIGVDKPLGMTSHDVVSRCRRIFGERRIGHAGTLDPAASGVMLVCVGPATRLDAYLVGHDKTYVVDVAFGASTETDDAEGAILETAAIPDVVYDAEYASFFVKTLVGKMMQLPPLYSAIKKNGKKACDEARKGNSVELEPRPVEIYNVEFLALIPATEECPYPCWRLEVSVSKGTYIRSFARDLGRALNTVAHVHALRRTVSGSLPVEACASLDALAEVPSLAVLDPVALLEYRFAFIDDETFARVSNGNFLKRNALDLMNAPALKDSWCPDCCFPAFVRNDAQPAPDELISLVHDNKLVALYKFDADKNAWRAACIFNPAVSREGFDL